MKVLVQSALILDPNSPHNGKKVNVLIDRGRISYIGKKQPDAKHYLKSESAVLSPGWIDMRAHFCDPGLEHKEDILSGRSAAMAGGFTQVVLLPNTEPVIQTKNDISYLKSSNAKSLVELLPLAAVTKGAKGEDLTEMIDLHEAGAVAFSDGTKPIANADLVLKTLQYLQKFDGLLIDQPEDKHLNMFGAMHEGAQSTVLGMKGMPKLAEEIIVQRNLDILNYAGGRLHLANISSERSLSLIKAAKKKGLSVSCDIAAYQASFVDTALADFDSSFKVNPPFRESKDNRAIAKGLKDETIDVIVSNHQPHDEESKKLEFDLAEFGISGIQTVAPCLAEFSKSVEMEKLIAAVTVNPRELLGLEQPVIKEGELANLTLFDPEAKWKFDRNTNKSKSINSPFWDKDLKGKVLAVFNNGLNQIY